MDLELFKNYRKKVIDNCSQVVLGKEEQIEKLLISFICSGHVLLEDIPGTGKTMLLRAFSKTIGGLFKRIQFTPDLLPSDITGIHFYNQQNSSFEFREGPLFANVVLADEINRATPRTQSSLLEAMEERQVTIDGKSFLLEEPFIVLATQNPLESYGTFPLPEAQLDRFFMRLSLGYMKREEELKVMKREGSLTLLEELEQVVSFEETKKVRKEYKKSYVSDDVAEYIMDIIEATRKDEKYSIGVSTRGSIALYNASQALSLLRGRDFVIPEDVKYLASDVLSHRLNMEAGILGEATDYMDEIIENIKVPMED